MRTLSSLLLRLLCLLRGLLSLRLLFGSYYKLLQGYSSDILTELLFGQRWVVVYSEVDINRLNSSLKVARMRPQLILVFHQPVGQPDFARPPVQGTHEMYEEKVMRRKV